MVLYQTVEDRGNPEYIQAKAPFLCTREDAWLGHGYYLWDSFLINAHWWGETIYPKEGYVIVKFEAERNEKILDLYSKPEQILVFKEIVDELKKQSLLDERSTVSMIIEYLKKHTKFLAQYEAIRVFGKYSKRYDKIEKMFFSESSSKKQYLDLSPAIQICLFKKTSLNLSKGKIIHPIEYLDEIYL